MIGVKPSVTEEELRQILKDHGFSLQLRSRRKTGKQYAYAMHRIGRKVRTVYLCPVDDISQIDRQTIEAKLT